MTGVNLQGVICPLPTRSLRDHPLRSDFYDQAHLEGLVASINANGLWEPVVVRPLADSGKYEILSGHCRVRAIRRLKQPTVLCQLLSCDSHTGKLVFFSSRMLTRGVSAIEEALILRDLVEGDSMTMAAAGQLFGRSKWWVSRRLKLLAALEPAALELVSQGKLQPRLAQELSRVPRGTRDQLRMLSIVQKCHLSKEELTYLVDRWLKADETEKDRLCAGFESLCSRRGSKKSRATSGGELELYAAHQLRICARVLNEVVDTIVSAPLPAVDWWPAVAYNNLLGVLGKLGRLLGPDAASGGDLALAAVACGTAGKESV